jgi:hypothetical protein
VTFHRYLGAEGIPDARRMPSTGISAKTAPRTIGELLGRMEEFSKDEGAWRARYPWAERFVMGYPLPDWQRPLVWTDEQKSRFITSLWMQVDVGSYLVNDACEFVKVNGVEVDVMALHSDILLDGQQRLSALEDYFLGRLAAPGKDEESVLWTELSLVERRLFSNRTFSRSVVCTMDEDELRQIYDLRVFGGTPHESYQQASKQLFSHRQTG